MQDHLFLVNKR